MSATRIIDGVQVTRLAKGWRFMHDGRATPERRRLLTRRFLELERAEARAPGRRLVAELAARAHEHQPIARLERDATPRPPDWGANGPGPRSLDNCLREAVSVSWPVPVHLIPPMPDDDNDPEWREKFVARLVRAAGLHLEVANEPPTEDRYVAVVHTENEMHAVAMNPDGTVLHDPARLVRAGSRLDCTIAYIFRPKTLVDRWGARLAS